MDHVRGELLGMGGGADGVAIGQECGRTTTQIVEPPFFFLLFFHFLFLLGGTGMRMAHFCAWSGQQDEGGVRVSLGDAWEPFSFPYGISKCSLHFADKTTFFFVIHLS